MGARAMTDEAFSGYGYDDQLPILRQIAYNLAEIADQLEAMNARIEILTTNDMIDEWR